MIELFTAIAAKTGIPALLLLSICTVETGLANKNNFSDKNGGSYGICSINVNTARMFVHHVDQLALQQVPVNAEIAALYIKKLQERYGDDFDSIVAAYNAGSAIVRDGEYINKNYVAKVTDVYNNLMKEKVYE